MIKVGVLGARGRMGSQVRQTVAAADGLAVGAEVDQGDPRDPLAGCDVVVDFTHPGAVLGNLQWCIGKGLDTVVGTSGFDEPRLAQVRGWLATAPSVRVLIVPNFSVGAVLMMRFAEQAARFFTSAEVKNRAACWAKRIMSTAPTEKLGTISTRTLGAAASQSRTCASLGSSHPEVPPTVSKPLPMHQCRLSRTAPGWVKSTTTSQPASGSRGSP